MSGWYTKSGNCSDVAVYTKISLSRNIKGYPFPNRLKEDGLKNINELIKNTLLAYEEIENDFNVIEMDKLPYYAALSLAERGLVSYNFILNNSNKLLFLSKDETISIMICGEDHIKVTGIMGGMELSRLFTKIDSIDNIICGSLPIAFDDTLGFLTESPMLLGTAMNCELLLHMPAMDSTGEIRGIADSVSRIGLTIKGVTNSDGYNNGSMYTLSNQITLGITERTAIENLISISNQVIARERSARESIDALTVEDKIFRAVAILKNARKINKDELDELLSELKLGISMGLVGNYNHSLPHELYVGSLEGTLQLKYGELLEDDISFKRAEYIRNVLKESL